MHASNNAAPPGKPQRAVLADQEIGGLRTTRCGGNFHAQTTDRPAIHQDRARHARPTLIVAAGHSLTLRIKQDQPLAGRKMPTARGRAIMKMSIRAGRAATWFAGAIAFVGTAFFKEPPPCCRISGKTIPAAITLVFVAQAFYQAIETL